MNRAFLLCVVLLFAIGLLMVFNTTSAEVLNRSLECGTHHALLKQLLYAILGGVGAFFVWVIGYRAILSLAKPLFYFTTFLLILVFIPGIGQQINGARRWLGFFSISFQPSEFAKFVIPLYYIHVATLKKMLSFKEFIKLIATIAVPISLILIEPDNGTVAIILSSLVILFFLTRVKWTYWVLPLLVFLIGGGVVASQMAHVPDRIHIYLHPELDLQGKGHQPHQAKIAAGSGRVFGKGLGESLQKLEYLPEARSDYIAAIFAEEFGFMGILLLIIVYMMIGYLGLRMAMLAPDIQGTYVVAIFTFLICIQAFLNLGVVSGLLPSKGTNLPFFSQGGSSLLANCLAVCVILNVYKLCQSQKKYS